MSSDIYDITQDIGDFSEIRFYGIEDVDCGEALATILLTSQNRSLRVFDALKSIVGSLFFRNFSAEVKGEENIHLYFTPSYHDRADQRKVFRDVVNCAENTRSYESEKCFRWSWKRLGKLHYVAKWMKQLRRIRGNVGFRLYCCATLFSGMVLADECTPKQGEQKPNLCVTFCDAHPIDYFITHWYNRIGVPTATLQHGIYGAAIPNGHSSFQVTHSTYFLAVNEQEVRKYKRCEAKGTPLVVGELKFIANQPDPKQDRPIQKVMGVVLSNSSDEANERLLACAQSVAKRCGMKVLFRCHPGRRASDLNAPIDPQLCEENKGELRTLVEHCDFAVADWNTTAVSDLIVMGCPIIRYYLGSSGDPYRGVGIPYFSDETSLEHIIGRYMEKPAEMKELYNEIRERLCPEGNIRDHYVQFLKDFD